MAGYGISQLARLMCRQTVAILIALIRWRLVDVHFGIKAASPLRSIALLIIGRLPEQILPVADLRLHASDAIQKRGEVSDAMGL